MTTPTLTALLRAIEEEREKWAQHTIARAALHCVLRRAAELSAQEPQAEAWEDMFNRARDELNRLRGSMELFCDEETIIAIETRAAAEILLSEDDATPQPDELARLWEENERLRARVGELENVKDEKPGFEDARSAMFEASEKRRLAAQGKAKENLNAR